MGVGEEGSRYKWCCEGQWLSELADITPYRPDEYNGRNKYGVCADGYDWKDNEVMLMLVLVREWTRIWT